MRNIYSNYENTFISPTKTLANFSFSEENGIKNTKNKIQYSNLSYDNREEFNDAIHKFIQEIKRNFEMKFIYYIKNNELSEFFDSEIEKDFVRYYKRSDIATIKWLSDVWLHHLDNSNIILNLVKLMSKHKFNDTSIYLMIKGLFSHQNIELRDYAIRFFEAMSDKNSLIILKNTMIDYPDWLEEYRQQIINDIEETLQNDM